jgi:metal-responsive CopG/Arc/MetJ family transcriptional regulator
MVKEKGFKKGMRTRKALGSTIDADLYDELDRLTRDTRIPKSKLLDEAIELLLKHYGRETNTYGAKRRVQL